MTIEQRLSVASANRRAPRISRNRTVSTKLTESEYADVEHVAKERGQWLSEWVRDTLLTAIRSEQSAQQAVLFAEVQALRLLLVNTLEPLLRGEKMSPEQFKAMLQYVKANKRKAASDMLASYAGGQDQP